MAAEETNQLPQTDKQARMLQAALVSKLCRPTHSLTGVRCRAASVAKKEGDNRAARLGQKKGTTGHARDVHVHEGQAGRLLGAFWNPPQQDHRTGRESGSTLLYPVSLLIGC